MRIGKALLHQKSDQGMIKKVKYRTVSKKQFKDSRSYREQR
jgi:hypothetical protein